MNLRKVLTLDAAAATISQGDLGIAIPSGQVIRFNAIRVMATNTGSGAVSIGAVYAGLLAKDIGATIIDADYIAMHDAVMGYSPLIGLGLNSGVIAMTPDQYMGMVREPCALEPEVFIGLGATGANTGVFEVLFDIDYDVIKMTSKVCQKLAVLN